MLNRKNWEKLGSEKTGVREKTGEKTGVIKKLGKKLGSERNGTVESAREL